MNHTDSENNINTEIKDATTQDVKTNTAENVNAELEVEDNPYIKKLKKESAKHRHEAKELQEKLSQLENQVKLMLLEKEGITDPEDIEFYEFKISKGVPREQAITSVKAKLSPRNVSVSSTYNSNQTSQFTSVITKEDFDKLSISQKIELHKLNSALYERLTKKGVK